MFEKIGSSIKNIMIDEFQDTDNIQYKIFSQLFGHAEDRALLMIGDPKQSIYKFLQGCNQKLFLLPILIQD